MKEATRRPTVRELESTFRNITLMMYDTAVSKSELEERVCPFLAADIEFSDPWLRADGLARFKTGLFGFHDAFRFDLTINHMAVMKNSRGDGGQVLVEGVMNLRSIPGYMYPLRTILLYDFTLAGSEVHITRLEEMWSFGDMILKAPLLAGRFYDQLFRPAAAVFFDGFFRLATFVRHH